MSKKTILVTGGAGFIGSHVNQMLYEEGYETVIFDNLSKGNAKAIMGGHFVQGELADQSALNLLFKQHSFDAVMHFAAFTDVGESVREPSLYYHNNVMNSLHLLDVMHKHSVNTLIFSSSAAVYGNPEEAKLTEMHPCKPINPYGETKLIMERIIRDYGSAYGLKSICLRYFNAAGGDPKGVLKNYQTKANNLIPLALKSLLEEQTLTIFGTDYPTKDGTCIRDYVHICDLGAAHIASMKKLWAGGESAVYNLGNGNGFSVLEVVAAIEKVTGRKLKIQLGPRRPGDPPVLIADSSKAMEELKWKSQYSTLEAMISHAWKALE